jgi:hypothetical protein
MRSKSSGSLQVSASYFRKRSSHSNIKVPTMASDPQAVAQQIEDNNATMKTVVERAVGLAEQGFEAAKAANERAARIQKAAEQASVPASEVTSWNARLDAVASGLGKLLVLGFAVGVVWLAVFYAPGNEGRVANTGFLQRSAA